MLETIGSNLEAILISAAIFIYGRLHLAATTPT
jgi:hypothetical protein